MFWLQVILILILVLAIVFIGFSLYLEKRFKKSGELTYKKRSVQLSIIGFIILIVCISLQFIYNLIII